MTWRRRREGCLIYDYDDSRTSIVRHCPTTTTSSTAWGRRHCRGVSWNDSATAILSGPTNTPISWARLWVGNWERDRDLISLCTKRNSKIPTTRRSRARVCSVFCVLCSVVCVVCPLLPRFTSENHIAKHLSKWPAASSLATSLVHVITFAHTIQTYICMYVYTCTQTTWPLNGGIIWVSIEFH